MESRSLAWQDVNKLRELGTGLRAADKCLPAHEINTAIDTNESTSPHVTNQAIVLDWEVTSLFA